MPTAQKADKFANIANLIVTETAANTLTFEQLQTGAGVFEKVALLIHRIEYVLTTAVLNLLLANDDLLEVAWCTSNQITGLAKDKAEVIDQLVVDGILSGTSANRSHYFMPVVHDFSNLPGGGIIYPAPNIYLAIEGTSLASAAFCRSCMYFSYVTLAGEDFWELVQATRALTG